MSLRHLTSSQNKEMALLLLGMARAIWIAALVSLFFSPNLEGEAMEYWLGAIAVGTLLAILGIMVLGRAEKAALVESDSAGRKPKRRVR